jgi:hypothetical protein
MRSIYSIPRTFKLIAFVILFFTIFFVVVIFFGLLKTTFLRLKVGTRKGKKLGYQQIELTDSYAKAKYNAGSN